MEYTLTTESFDCPWAIERKPVSSACVAASEWGDTPTRDKQASEILMGDTPISGTGTPCADTPTTESFNCPWANREEARRLVLALPPSSRGHSHNRTYKHQESDGGHSH